MNELIPEEGFRWKHDTLHRSISLVKEAGIGALMAKFALLGSYRRGLATSSRLTAPWLHMVELTTGYFVKYFSPVRRPLAVSPTRFLRCANALNFIIVQHAYLGLPVPCWTYTDYFHFIPEETSRAFL